MEYSGSNGTREKKAEIPHRLTLDSRRGGALTGVKDVSCFDEKELLLLTTEGRLQIKGEQLHVKRLDLEKGEVDIEGKVDQISYLSGKTKKTETSLWKRMFR